MILIDGVPVSSRDSTRMGVSGKCNRDANLLLRWDFTEGQILEPHLLGRKGTWGGNARNNRKFIHPAIKY